MTTIIAEIGINWQGDMDLAKSMILSARGCGADIAKFQVYNPDRILDPEHPVIKPWWDLIKKTELTCDQVQELAATCADVGIEFMASVFHPDRVQWLEDAGVKRHKIASRSLYNEPLAAALAATGKPILASYGMHAEGCTPPIQKYADSKLLSHLYCVSEYPTPLEHIDLARMLVYDGFSDHTEGITASVVAMSLGAKIIEKHVTCDKEFDGPDHASSITFCELGRLCNMRDQIDEILY